MIAIFTFSVLTMFCYFVSWGGQGLL